MANYKPPGAFIGSTAYQVNRRNLEVLRFRFGLGQSTKSLHDSKNDTDYKVDPVKKFKMVSVGIEWTGIIGSGNIEISESSTTDVIGTIKYIVSGVGASGGFMWFPCRQVKFDSDKYIVVRTNTILVGEVIVVGFEE